MTGKSAVNYYTVRGQQLVSAAGKAALNQDDYLVITYRGYQDQIAQSVSLSPLIAEMARKIDGPAVARAGRSISRVFYEAISMAQLWKLPVICLCHKNRYGEQTVFAIIPR